MRWTLALLCLSLLSYTLAEQCTPATKCDSSACKSPDCHCSGEETIISDLDARPQIVYLTFDDGFTALAEETYYHELFNGNYKNPNGCNIRATHFVTQTSTDYSLVNQYWHLGHEMAAHSVSHRNNQTYWEHMSAEEWRDEMVGVRKMIGQFANIPPCEVKGMRAPFLQGGGDNMFQMLAENNFLYDCSWPTRAYGYIDAEYGLYPYTLDYASKQDCPIAPCPECSHPGVWVQPMLDLEDEWYGSNPNCPTCGNICSMLDGCVIPSDLTADHVYNMIMKNFLRVYSGETDSETGNFQRGNKAPWGLYVHAAWFFGQDYHWQGYKMFLSEITNSTKYPDVFVVPVEAGISYMQNPLPMQVLENYGKDDRSPFGCKSIEDQSGKFDGSYCGGSQSCKFELDVERETRYMTICKNAPENGRQTCPDPDQYPSLGNICGGNDPCLDCVP